jgi:hypothetical protein
MAEGSSREAITTIYCPAGLRTLWVEDGSVLPAQWHSQYPMLFDDDDLQLAGGLQRTNHFSEWFAAIHIFQRDGSRSLVEKYDTYENHKHGRRSKEHRRKVAEYERVVPESEREVLHAIGSEFGVQLPDLFVVSADGMSFGFAEVKGPTDNSLNRPDQKGSRDAIRERLGVPVEIVKVRLLK